MQSNKPSSKKTRQIAETGNTAVPEFKSTAPETMPKPRSKTSSTVKKNETSESTSAMRHRKAASTVVAENAVAPPKAMAASAGASSSFSTPASTVESQDTKISVSREEIAKLAHSYWVARGYTQGNPDEDWLRAETELLSRS